MSDQSHRRCRLDLNVLCPFWILLVFHFVPLGLYAQPAALLPEAVPPFAPGGSVSFEQLFRYGFARWPGGAPPFGVAAGGQPYWPFSALASSSPKSVLTAPLEIPVVPPLELPSALFESLLGVDAPAPGAPHLFRSDLRPGTSGTGVVSRPTTSPILTRKDLATHQGAFLQDCCRHARAVFEGDNLFALNLSLKWQDIAKKYPDQIEAITCGGCAQAGFPDFPSWIDNAVILDWGSVGQAGLPPVLLTNTTAAVPSAPPADTATSEPTTGPLPTRIADAIYAQMNIWGNVGEAQLLQLADELDLEGPGAKQPILDIIYELTGNDPNGLKQLADTLTSGEADVAAFLADKIANRLEADWGGTLSPANRTAVDDLARRTVARLKQEVTQLVPPP